MNSQRWRGRARVVHAMSLIALSSAAQKVIPMTRWSWVIGEPGEIPPTWTPGPEQTLPPRSADIEEERVRRAIRRASARLPWTPTCLSEAVAGQVMLRQRGKSGVVVVGLRATDDGHPWGAHAWLLGGSGALTGGPAAAGFTATAVFEVPHGLRAQDVDLISPPCRG